jgi:hypothetical protein
MSNRNPTLLSGILTVLILFMIAILAMLIQIIALNGVMDKRALVAMSILLVGQGIVLFLGWKFSGWACRSLITKFNFSGVAAVALTVLATSGLGAITSFVLIVCSILLAGIR